MRQQVERNLEIGRALATELERGECLTQMIASVLRDGIAAGEFRTELDVASVADVIQQLHIDYSTRAYRRDPEFPANDELIDAACRFIQDAVKADGSSGPAEPGRATEAVH